MSENRPLNLAIFASGSGSNAEKIMQHFNRHHEVNIVAVISNQEKAGVLDRAEKYNVPSHVFSTADFESGSPVLQFLKRHEVDVIVLAGFLLKISADIVTYFPNKILNIHPALLPKYGGKGMYGHFVHEAVINHQETESGISIHLVNENYDEGEVIFQAKCAIHPQMGSKQLAAKVQQLEHQHYPKVIEEYILKLKESIVNS